MREEKGQSRLNGSTMVALLLILLGIVLTAGQTLTNSTGTPLFVVMWLLKTLAVALTVTAPVLLGAQSQSSDHTTILGGVMVAIGAVFSVIDRFCPQPPTDPRELYLMANVFAFWLMMAALVVMAPRLKNVLASLPLQFRRRVAIAVGLLFFITNLVWHRDFFGFRTGNTITWLLFLFLVGDVLQSDHSWRHFSNWQFAWATLGSWLLAGLEMWHRTNIVQYSPHDGLASSNHYLVGLSSTQSFMLVLVVMLAAWYIKNHQQATVADGGIIYYTWVLGMMIAAQTLAAPFFRTGWPAWLLDLTEVVIVTVVVAIGGRLTIFWWRRHHQPVALLTVLQRAGRWVVHHWRAWLAIFSAWLLVLFSYLLLWDGSFNMLSWIMKERTALVWLNIAILLAIFGILMAITNWYWPSLFIMIIFSLGWTTASQLKIASRDEPILPSDLSMVTAPRELLGMVNGNILLVAGLTLVGLIIVAALLQRKDHYRGLTWQGRLGLLVVSVTFLGCFKVANHPHSPVKSYLESAQDVPYFYKQIRGAKINGTLLQFANNVDVTVMARPADYSAANMKKLAQKYQRIGANINRDRRGTANQQSLIFILSESFADPRRVPTLTVHGGNPLPFISQLKKQTTGGLMLSSGYGGGTANMEYMALTGLSEANFSATLPTPYSQLVPYQRRAWSINQLFNYSQAVHPFSGQLYSRNKVYPKFKFNRFYCFGSHPALTYTRTIDNNPRVADSSTYRQTLKVLADHQGGQFIQVATMQNHMPYLENYYRHHRFRVSGAAADGSSQQKIETYTQGISYTDEATREFLTSLDKVDKPVTVVWYGDHLPGIYGHVSMNRYGVQLHETDYWIYSNKAAAGHGKRLSHRQLVSPNDFPAMALAQMGVKVSPYYALLTRVYTQLPAMSLSLNGTDHNNTVHTGGTSFVNAKGKQVSLTHRQQQLLHDYQLVQYDLTAGHQYLFNNTFLKNPAK
ncbi:LTA synthase family protein [uncultured Limosilactobacillus sp.]|uniref:LTA synthase family protein n=1 Tax=uncultured Limosilactobacillus sp. TaxID=2837629 RepID=UPI0025E66DB8|nr:LTA synthase family protein [uncultured Limosilactobacillus sp.]